MTIKVALEHRTTYHFDRPVHLGPHVVRLRPAPHTRTPIDAYSLRVEPDDHFLNWQQDPFGNFQARLVFPEPTTKFEIVVDLVADMTVVNPFDFFLEPEAETVPFEYGAELRSDLAPYLATMPMTPLLQRWLDQVKLSADQPIRTIDFLVGLNQRLANDIDYSVRMEPGVQTPETTLSAALGSCRDSSWLLVQIFRHLGFAARFVSGYLVQLVADIAPLEGPSGPTQDFTDLHAWTEVYLPGAGWVGLDATSGLIVGEGHIPLAATPSPSTAAPISGSVGAGGVEFSFSNIVTRLHEDPRVTKPYDEAQWNIINQRGLEIDERLVAGDVRLTQGGEPTFVSVDDYESDEWKIVADGDNKRRLAAELTARLFDRFADGGVSHHGQGKWYPGEPLPRWQHALIWRTDGVPIWNDRRLLGHPSPDRNAVGPPNEATGPAKGDIAEVFARALAANLGVGSDGLRPAFEDPLFALWEEGNLPNGDPPADDLGPADPALDDEAQRRAILDTIGKRHGEPKGWVLPLIRRGSWRSIPWTLRRSDLFLVPGSSPVGYRLPINSLQWGPIPPKYEPSPFAEPRPFGEEPATVSIETGDGAAQSTEVLPPTALCLEVRNHQLYLFLPPLDSANDALELLSVLEHTAAEVNEPIVIEGYPIPSDPRLRNIVVASDPGVIEVNVPPAASWPELVSIVEGVEADAHASRLGTERFDIDGTHTGTGGGNHVTLGGPTPADSPLLRKPSLLRSMITYWQHHPSLSYLFSGRFIGPSSQAPRVDEARDDALYELETAFAELDRIGDDDVPPWMIDRLLRHLLVDLTGNTHRAEFCIDKLFSPDSERGRWGVLELRAFEMPPHPRMALVQSLLVRSIVARCWESPYRHDPIRWGTALHDRYLLPWFIEQDLHEVIDDLADHGIELDHAWFDPFIEFRFPRHGTVTVDGVTLELRGAIEPWHVLGEESSGSGTARYVDSSVERLQLRVEGAVDGRHLVTCNGVEVPLTPTGIPGLSVAGVRFKAWAPPSGLHPTIGVQSPLTFDVVDARYQRSLGGGRYHVVHQGGLSHAAAPVNASEAESRRQTRFESIGHSPGTLDVERTRITSRREYPVTLDLRRVRGNGSPSSG